MVAALLGLVHLACGTNCHGMQITVTVATLALQLLQVKPGSCHSVVPLEPPGCKTLDVVLMDGRYHLIQVEAAPPRHRKLQVVAVSDHQLPMLVAPAPRKCHDLPLIAVGCHRLLSFVPVVPT